MMWALTIMLMAVLNPNPMAINALRNAYVDAYVTTEGLNEYGYLIEGNPIAHEIFKRYNNYEILYTGYYMIIGLSMKYIPEPLNNFVALLLQSGHLWGASTWNGVEEYPTNNIAYFITLSF